MARHYGFPRCQLVTFVDRRLRHVQVSYLLVYTYLYEDLSSTLHNKPLRTMRSVGKASTYISLLFPDRRRLRAKISIRCLESYFLAAFLQTSTKRLLLKCHSTVASAMLPLMEWSSILMKSPKEKTRLSADAQDLVNKYALLVSQRSN